MQLKVFGLRFSTLLTMKLLILLTIIACLQSSARGFGQPVTLSLENAPLEKAFKEIKKQTGYSFVYTRVQLKNTLPINCQVKNGNLKEVLELCFRNQPLSYLIEDRYIVVQTKFAVEHPISFSQILRDVSGKIINEDGDALPSVTVTAKHSKKVTITNEQGEFTLKDLANDDVLLITMVGYLNREISVSNQGNLLISLKLAIGSLDETIVIGYGKTTRRYNVGSISKISAEEIGKQPVSNPLSSLQGLVPGLVVTSTSGVPGAAIKIQIRGQNSLNPNPDASGINPLDQPLFIIDGVPFAPQNSNINQFSSIAAPPSGTTAIYNNPYGGLSPFNTLNPSDIESIEVLRDASETAIYGSRGANGVILITTKRGKPGKTNLGLNVYRGISHVTRAMDLMNTQQFLEMRREGFRNDGAAPTLNPGRSYAPDLLIFDSTRYTDWKEFFLGGSATTTDINGVISGGTAHTQFLIGSGYHHETYIYPGDFGSYRATVNINLHHQSADKRFSVDFSSNFSYSKNNSSGSEDALKAFTLAPNFPSLENPDGSLRWSYNNFNLIENPLAYLKQKYTASNTNLISHFLLSYTLSPGLTVKSSIGYNNLSGDEIAQKPKSTQPPTNNPISYSNFGYSNYRTWVIEPQLDYTKSIGKFKMSILFGSTTQKNTNSGVITEASNYANDDLMGSISAAGATRTMDQFSEYKYAGFFGRGNFIWDKKFILTITGRRDGSSRFGSGRQFGNFGSVGGGWLFSEDSLFKNNLPWVSYGKIRANYGTTGSDGVGDYQFMSRWGIAGNPIQGSSGYQPQNLPNSKFSWSITKKFEAGLDLGFLKDKIVLSTTWFVNRCGNQLVTFALPSQTGFPGVTANFPALVQNKGIEFQITSTNISNKHFRWVTSFNISAIRNKLVSFPGLAESSYAFIYVVGQSTSALKKYTLLGVDPANGNYVFATKTGTPTSTPNASTDRAVIGSLDPKFFGGLNNTITWKNLDVSFLFYFTKQLGANYLQQINIYPPGSSRVNQPVAALDRWQKSGDIASFQRYTYRSSGSPAANAASYFINSSGAYSDASFVRLRMLSITYKLNANFIQKAGLKECKIYMNAQNLFTITNYKGNDPETQSFYSLPSLKTVVGGIQFNF